MTGLEFDEFLEESQILQRETLKSKAKEYSSNDDRFEDFKLIADIARIPLNMVFRILTAKHIVSSMKLLSGELSNTKELRQEKFGDAENYLVLAKAWLENKSINKNKE